MASPPEGSPGNSRSSVRVRHRGMKSSSCKRIACSLPIAAACVLALPAPAAACLNAVAEAEDDDVIALRAADKALDVGEPGRASSLLRSAMPDLAQAKPRVGDDPTSYRTNHALRIAALAAVRTEGDAGDSASNAENLRWARGTLEALDALRDAPMQRTNLAEARERTNPDAAKAALEDLARQDLLVTPYGYGALARLRADEGDAAGADRPRRAAYQMAAAPAICERPKADRSLPASRNRVDACPLANGLILATITAAVFLAPGRAAGTTTARQAGRRRIQASPRGEPGGRTVPIRQACNGWPSRCRRRPRTMLTPPMKRANVASDATSMATPRIGFANMMIPRAAKIAPRAQAATRSPGSVGAAARSRSGGRRAQSPRRR